MQRTLFLLVVKKSDVNELLKAKMRDTVARLLNENVLFIHVYVALCILDTFAYSLYIKGNSIETSELTVKCLHVFTSEKAAYSYL